MSTPNKSIAILTQEPINFQLNLTIEWFPNQVTKRKPILIILIPASIFLGTSLRKMSGL